MPKQGFFFMWCMPVLAVPLLASAATLDSGDSPHEKKFIVRNIVIEGNRKTRKFIIERELGFLPGDTLSKEELEEILKTSEQNLRNTSLFNFADVKAVPLDYHSGDIRVTVVERWYIWPSPLFEIAETNFNTWWINKNFSRTNYGFYLVKQNFRGRNEWLKIRLRFGYSEQLALQYLVPFINRKRTIGAGFTAGYSRNHEINYGTLNNKRIFYKDKERYIREEWFAETRLDLRRKLYNSHRWELEYADVTVADTLSVIASDYLQQNTTRTRFVSLSWLFRHDRRDNAAYPLRGHVFAIELKQWGVDFASDSGLHLLTPYLTFNEYYALTNRFYFAHGLKLKSSLIQSPPYFLQRGLGYGDNVRGYEYYVVDGQHYALLKSNVKYELIKPRKVDIGFIKNEQFSKMHYALYFNLYADAGYVKDDIYYYQNPLANSFLFGAGAGLDYVTYYDATLRLEYSVNRMQEHGFFVHFVKSI